MLSVSYLFEMKHLKTGGPLIPKTIKQGSDAVNYRKEFTKPKFVTGKLVKPGQSAPVNTSKWAGLLAKKKKQQGFVQQPKRNITNVQRPKEPVQKPTMIKKPVANVPYLSVVKAA